MWCKSGLWSWKLNETHLSCERHFCKQSRSEDTLCTDIKCPSRTSSIKNERNENILLRFSSEAPQSSRRLPRYYMKFSRHKKNREIKVTRKLRDSYYVHNKKERVCYHWNVYKSHFLLCWWIFSVNGCCGQRLKNNNSPTSVNCLWTLWELLGFLNFYVIVPLIKWFNSKTC